MAAGKRESYLFGETFDNCQSVDRIRLRLGLDECGVSAIGGQVRFEWTLSVQGWISAANLVEPFCRRAEGGYFQWLDEHSGISLLLTPNGHW
jgi:hypothetical protein